MTETKHNKNPSLIINVGLKLKWSTADSMHIVEFIAPAGMLYCCDICLSVSLSVCYITYLTYFLFNIGKW